MSKASFGLLITLEFKAGFEESELFVKLSSRRKATVFALRLAPLACFLLNLDQLNIKDQCGIRADCTACALFAVSEF